MTTTIEADGYNEKKRECSFCGNLFNLNEFKYIEGASNECGPLMYLKYTCHDCAARIARLNYKSGR